MKITQEAAFHVIFLFLLTLYGCSSPSEPEPSYLQSLQEAPMVTGIYITTPQNPDGTGEKIGRPSYSVKRMNVFPNPYNSPDPEISDQYMRFMRFIRLPDDAIIVIVKARAQMETTLFSGSVMSLRSVITGITVVKTIGKKNQNNPYPIWDMRDENGNLVSPGFYRAYIFGKDIPSDSFLDIFVESNSPDFIDRF